MSLVVYKVPSNVVLVHGQFSTIAVSERSYVVKHHHPISQEGSESCFVSHVNSDFPFFFPFFFSLLLVNPIVAECLSASRCHSSAADRFPRLDQIDGNSCGRPLCLETLMAVCWELFLFSVIRKCYML